jgi:hypothetical protein
MVARVAKDLDFMPSTDPWYSDIIPLLNRAANTFIRMKAGPDVDGYNLFPELARVTWTIGPTYPIDGTIIVDANTIAQPDDCFVVTAVKRAESATLPDWTTTQELPVNFIEWETFGLIQKDTAAYPDYIRQFTRKGKTIKVWPSITSGFPDYLRFYGIACEQALTDDAQSFFVNEHWHDLICTLTAAQMARRMGLYQQARELMAEVASEIGMTTDVTAKEGGDFAITVHGMPSAASVYGAFRR